MLTRSLPHWQQSRCCRILRRHHRSWQPLTSQFNSSTHRRRQLGESITQARRSSLDIFPQSLDHDASAELHPRAYIRVFATSELQVVLFESEPELDVPVTECAAALSSLAAAAAGHSESAAAAAERHGSLT